MDLFAYYEKKDKIDAANLVNKNANETKAFNNQVNSIRAMIDLIIKNIHETQSPPDAYELITFNDIKYIGWQIAHENSTRVWLSHNGTLLFHDSDRHRDDQYAEITVMEISNMEEYSQQYSSSGNLCKSQMEKDGLDGTRINLKKIIKWLVERSVDLKIAGNPEWEALVSATS